MATRYKIASEELVNSTSKNNLIKNGNFINNSTNGYGGTPDDFTNSSGNPVQGGFPSFTKQQLIDLLGIADGDIEGLWNLNEASGNATDLSSNGYDLTDTNTVLSSDDGLMGKARDFENNNSEYFTIADANCANLEIAGNKTIIAFVKHESVSITQNIISKRKNTVAGGFNLMSYWNGTKQVFDFYLHGLSTTNVTADVVPEAGKWYMLVAVRDLSNNLLKLWVNGIKKEVASTGNNTDTNAPFVIGADFLAASDTASNFFDGLIQNASVLSVALTDSQVKKLWAYTTYKGQKIRRATSDGFIYQVLDEALVDRLRGKTVTMRATMWQDTASIGQININDGSDNKSTTTATTGSWVTVSKTVTISATATAITLKLEANTSDGNVWFKEVAFYEGSGVAPYSHSQDDVNRFPRLLKLNPPAMHSAYPYQYEENRVYTYTPTWVGYSASPSGGLVGAFSFNGDIVRLNITPNSSGTSNANTNTATLPIIAKTVTDGFWRSNISAVDNNAVSTTVDSAVVLTNGSIVTFYKNQSATGWTTSSGKRPLVSNIIYQIE